MYDLLLKIADQGKAVCDTPEMRKLWYKELVHWVSPTEVALTSTGLSMLYRLEEERSKNMPRLEQWCVVYHRLYGKVYGREGFEDGAEINTSKVISIDREKGTATTKNTTYLLGEPDSDWLRNLAFNSLESKTG